MKILVINADCLNVNSSANLCHLAYIRGLVDLGHDVTLISADGRDYSLDPNMEVPSKVRHYTYYGVTFYEKLSLKKKKALAAKAAPADSHDNAINSRGPSVTSKIIEKAKKTILSMYGVYGIHAKFLRRALKLSLKTEFDFVVSIATPPASHMLTYKLLKKGRIKAKKWIQIWEDPWHSDVYGFNGSEKIRKEEKRLLSYAERVCYVSPITLKTQKEKYPESAHKMYWQPLPFYYKSEPSEKTDLAKNVYGYFGDYSPEARDLSCFYEAAREAGIEVNICGGPHTLFEPCENIHIYPRMTLDKLKPIEDKTNVLIFLCNRKGGQIPGKIYQYSATDKIVLFIMDGTDEEQEVLHEYFKKYNRYVFCKNTKDDILRVIEKIESGNLGDVSNTPVDAFDPKLTITKILNEGAQCHE